MQGEVMSKAGQNNIKGINYQAKAALLLFLLKLNDGGFDSITLEDENWEDFTLNYVSGKKIVCESKNHAAIVGDSLVKSILENIEQRVDSLNKEDEILIVCPKAKPELTKNLQYIAWFPETRKQYIERGFSDKQVDLLSKTSFYLADEDFLYQEMLTYFYAKIGYWLPEEEIVGLLNTVLVDQIYEKSARGMTFTRADLLGAIDNYSAKKIELNGVYDSKQTEIAEQIQAVLDDIKGVKSTSLKRDLTVLTAQPQKMFIVIDTVFGLDNLKLEKWDFLWSPLLDRQYAFRIMHEFEQFIDNKDNAEYVLRLFTKQARPLTNKAVDRFHGEYALQLVLKIIKKFPDMRDLAFEFCREYFGDKQSNYFDLEDRSDSLQEKQELSDILSELFDLYEGVADKQAALFEIVQQHFNLVEDDGEHSIYTPPAVFGILKKYIEYDFETNFRKVVDLIIEQYKHLDYYGDRFSGWELAGGTFSQSGNQYSVTDRHFIVFALRPALLAYYEQNPSEAWNFIMENCVAQKISDISSEKPDFLGRTAIPIIVREYASGANQRKALTVLKKQMFMRRGIPAKFELIFQELYNNNFVPDEKKWNLANEFLEKRKLPNSVFVEQVTAALAVKGNDGALNAIKSWVNDPNYRQQQTLHTFFISQSMFQLLATPHGSKTYETGVEILKLYIETDDFKTKLGTFHAYDVTKAIAEILDKDFSAGHEIIQSIYSSSANLTINQQLAICHPIEQIDKENKQLLKRVYDEVLKPIIVVDLQSNNKLIEARFPHNYARELIVQFAEHLAQNKLFPETLQLIRVFVKDSSPGLKNEPDDPDGKFNYHQRIISGEEQITINTVRGWVSWVLQKFSVVDGRQYISEATTLTERLTKDKNYYVRIQSTFPLAALVLNRHTYMPGSNNTKRFIGLTQARRIEKIAFQMLRDKDNVKYPVILKHLLQVFSRMRTLNVGQAWEMFEAYKAVSFENDVNDIYHLVIYYAIFRKDAFDDPTLVNLFGKKLYDEINSFDDTRFKKLLEDSIRKGNDDVRTTIAWEFWQLPKKDNGDFDEMFDLSLHYFKIFSERYTHHAYERIYYFIKDNVDTKAEECLVLWQALIEKEKAYIKDKGSSISRGEWWPCHYNGEFLTKLRLQMGDAAYVEMLDSILDYPEQFDPGINPEAAYAELKEINTKKSKVTLKKLCDNYPRLYTK